MSLLQLSEDAIAFARVCVPLKSDNKAYPLGHAKRLSADAMQNKNFALLNLRKAAYPVQGCTMQAVIHYGRLAPKYGAGNCLEQCAAASVDLSWKLRDGLYSFRLIYFAPPGDHIFIVLNQTHDQYPKDFGAWSADAVICDPWAKIACSAQEYPKKWKAKMDKWNQRGLVVSATGMGPGSATREGLYNAPDLYEKKPYTSD